MHTSFTSTHPIVDSNARGCGTVIPDSAFLRDVMKPSGGEIEHLTFGHGDCLRSCKPVKWVVRVQYGPRLVRVNRYPRNSLRIRAVIIQDNRKGGRVGGRVIDIVSGAYHLCFVKVRAAQWPKFGPVRDNH